MRAVKAALDPAGILNPGQGAVAPPMSKIIFWIVVIFAVLLGLRLLNVAKAKQRGRRRSARRGARPAPPRRARWCAARRCGVYLPRADARPGRRAYLRRLRVLRAAMRAAAIRARALDAPPPPRRPLEQPPLPLSPADSGRRILWIVGTLPRGLRGDPARYGAAARPAGAGDRGAQRVRHGRRCSISSSASARSGGSSATRFRCRCRRWCRSLLTGDVLFVALVMIAGGGTGGSLPILLFPQLAASGWLLRTQIGVLPRGARDASCCSVSTSCACSRVGSRATQLFQTGLIGFGYFATIGIARRARTLHQGVRGPRRAARHRRRQPRAGQPAHHPGHAGRRAGRRPQRRRARPQRAGHAPARRLRPDARRHAAGRVLARRCTTTGGAGRRTTPSRCRRSRSSRRSACCACAWCASAPA